MKQRKKGQLTLAVAVLQMDGRELAKRVKAIEGDFFVLLVGAATSTGIMLGYFVFWLVK